MFIALAVSLGFVLSRIPNIELMTATVFLSGFLLGSKKGLAVGFLAEGIYSLLNPYGMAPPPLFAAQAVSMGFSGLAGGWLGSRHPENAPFFAFKCALAGFFCTLFFDALTTLSFVPINHFNAKQLAASALFGVWFYAAHLASNLTIFAVLVPGLIKTARTQLLR
jgi:hypothetical protein